MFYIGLYSEILKKFFSETTRPRALIFGMLHLIVVLYQVCTNDGNGSAKGVTCSHMHI